MKKINSEWDQDKVTTMRYNDRGKRSYIEKAASNKLRGLTKLNVLSCLFLILGGS